MLLLWSTKELVRCFLFRWRITIKVVEIKAHLLLLLLSFLPSHGAEVTLANEVHQIHISTGFELIILLDLAATHTFQFLQDVAVEVVLLVAVVLLILLLVVCAFELVAVHAATNFVCDFPHLFLVVGFDHHSESVDQAFLRVIKFGKLDGEIERVDQLICLCFYAFSEVHKVLVHYERFFGFFVC